MVSVLVSMLIKALASCDWSGKIAKQKINFRVWIQYLPSESKDNK